MKRLKINRRLRSVSPVRALVALPLLAFPFALIGASAFAQQTPDERRDDQSKPPRRADKEDTSGRDDSGDAGDSADDSGVDKYGNATDKNSDATDKPGDKTDKSGTGKQTKRRKPPVPPPANPLVLRDPDNGSGNSSKNFDDKGNRKEPAVRKVRDYGDWNKTPKDFRERTREKDDLPLFGYNFFAPAREYIEAKRAALLRRYAPDSDYSATGDPRFLDSQSGPLPRYQVGKNGQRPKSVYDATPTGTRRVKPNPNRADGKTGGGNGSGANDETDDTSDNGNTPGDATDAAASRRRRNPGVSPQDAPYPDDSANPAPRRSPRDPSVQNDFNMDDEIQPLQGNAPRRTRRRPASAFDNALDNGYNDNRYSSSANGSASRSSLRGADPMLDDSPLDARNAIADPLTQLYRNVLASVPASYAISSGDSLTVSYSAPTLDAREFTGSVDTAGSFAIEGGGRVFLRGMSLDVATRAIKSRIAKLYKNVDVSVQLHELRTISVTVSGEAIQPGSFAVPAVASALNVLTAAGGPNENGTLRRIEVRRQGKLVGTLDIYNFLTGGIQSDISLQSGDLIIIPPRQSRVSLLGEVRIPAQYELLEGETLQDALRFSGGIKSSGVNQNVQINTLQPGQERILKTVDIRSGYGAAKTPLYDGDSVDVFSVRNTVANLVSVEGAVNQPNDYALGENMRVADLIQKARGVLPEASLHRADLYRWNPDNTTTLITVDVEKALANDPKENFSLAKWDRLKIYSRQEVAFTGLRKMEARGAVVKPGVYARSENTHVSDLLLRSGGPAPDAYLDRAVLLHQRGDGTYAYENVNVGEAIKGDPKNDVLIEDNDILAVYNVNEANFTPEHVVSVRGEVVAPGIYPRGAGMKLSEVILLAGGFRPGSGGTVMLTHARRRVDSKSAEATTVAVNFDNRGHCAPQSDQLVEDGDVVTIQGDGAFQNDVQTISITGAVYKPGPLPIMKKGMRLSEALALAGGLRPEAFPEGAEFYRNPAQLASTGQKTIVQTISAQMDLLNASQFKREQAKSAIELGKAASNATSESSGVAGLTGGGATQNAAGAAVVQTQLTNKELATAARQFKESDLTPNDNIAVNLPEALRKPGGFEDIILADGDKIVIPETPTTVQVIGAIYHSSGVQYIPNGNLDYYVQHAGGYVTDAARDRILIIRRGGGVLPYNKAGTMRPGDLIFVPTRVQAEKISSNHNAFNDIFKTLTNTALSAFVVTRLLP